MEIFGISEPVLRAGVFFSAFILFSTLEAIAPRRVRTQARTSRWPTNLSLLIVANGFVRLLVFAAPVIAASSAAALAADRGWGVLNAVSLPPVAESVIAFLCLDLAIWAQHVATHKIPILWKIHRVHHADRDFDASTALRFHPVEIVLSAVFKLGVILLLGPTVFIVILFEIALNASAMFNHTNLALPSWLDRALRWVLVTPDMHRVHHSVHRNEHDTNYGFCLSVWDRLFRTYTETPRDGHEHMTIGLTPYQSAPTQALGWSLWLPFRR